jgi:hypothetical protein
MPSQTQPHQSFTPEEIEAFAPVMKIGLLATVTPDGLPHITMLSSLKAANETTMTWGQFTEGTSFQNVQENPNIGWLIMTLDKDLCRGTGRFTHTATSGEDFDWYNEVPMFRYNAYFGIHTVYYMDLVEHTGLQPLPMSAVVLAAVKTLFSKFFLLKKDAKVLNSWTRRLFNRLDNLKFLATIDESGFPKLIPVIQAQAAGTQHILFSTGAFTEEIQAIPSGVPMAVFGLSLDMTDVLVRGTYQGLRWVGPHRCGVLEADWVYNPMPPVPGQIYPSLPLEPIHEFDSPSIGRSV